MLEIIVDERIEAELERLIALEKRMRDESFAPAGFMVLHHVLYQAVQATEDFAAAEAEKTERLLNEKKVGKELERSIGAHEFFKNLSLVYLHQAMVFGVKGSNYIWAILPEDGEKAGKLAEFYAQKPFLTRAEAAGVLETDGKGLKEIGGRPGGKNPDSFISLPWFYYTFGHRLISAEKNGFRDERQMDEFASDTVGLVKKEFAGGGTAASLLGKIFKGWEENPAASCFRIFSEIRRLAGNTSYFSKSDGGLALSFRTRSSLFQ